MTLRSSGAEQRQTREFSQAQGGAHFEFLRFLNKSPVLMIAEIASILLGLG